MVDMKSRQLETCRYDDDDDDDDADDDDDEDDDDDDVCRLPVH